ncbi:MAG: glycosyltransferase family 4 protein [Lentisphaerae bacterium]|jgi:glycosyltransferase involved in cell wall biosynthesis|nr:glycosyltransferase family 4 protein [Lentisphaerota bacterium]
MTARTGWHLGVNTLFLIPGRVGGSERYFTETMRALLPLHQGPCTLFTNCENDEVLRAAFKGCHGNLRFDCLGFRAASRPQRILREQFQLLRYIRRAGCDVLWSPGYTACLLTRCPQAVTIFDLQYRRFPEDLSPPAWLATHVLVSLAARRCRAIMTTSEFSKAEIVGALGVPSGCIAVTYAAADPAFGATPPDFAAPVPAPYLLSVSNSYPHKNLPALVQAFDTIATEIPHRLLLVGGPGRGEAELTAAIAAARHADRIERRSGLGDAELAACYRGADLFVLPSQYEGFGLPVLEAMQAGVPVVTTRGGSLAEVGGTVAMFADPGTPAALAEAIMHSLSRTSSEREAVVEAGRRHAAGFTWQRTARIVYGTLGAVCNRVAWTKCKREAPT